MPGKLHSHSTHAAHVGHAAAAFFLGDVGDHGFGGEHEAGDRGCVLESGAGDLGGVDNTRLDEVLVLPGRGVEAVGVFALGNLADDDRAFLTGVPLKLPIR